MTIDHEKPAAETRGGGPVPREGGAEPRGPAHMTNEAVRVLWQEAHDGIGIPDREWFHAFTVMALCDALLAARAPSEAKP